VIAAVLVALTVGASGVARAEDAPIECPKNPPKAPELSRSDVYKNTPFKPGESAQYEVTWGGAKVGYGTLEVRPPERYLNTWHRVFHVDAKTGDWFKAIFVAREEMLAYSRPWDFGVSKFFMEQNEGKLFGSRFVQKKWLEFDHDHCKVTERIDQKGKKEEVQQHDLAYGAIDAVGVIYQLRTRDFKIGKVERALVYTSEKNWYLEANPEKLETITTDAGTFETVKLKLQTFIGKELQQKGDVWAWVATKTPQRQLVQVQGEIKLGSVYLKLSKYTPGS
jgi:hypothetical protein